MTGVGSNTGAQDSMLQKLSRDGRPKQKFTRVMGTGTNWGDKVVQGEKTETDFPKLTRRNSVEPFQLRGERKEN